MRDKHSTQKILVTITLAIVLLLGSATMVVAWHTHKEGKTATTQTIQKVATSQEPITDLTYSGQDGKNALDLLKQHATVATKDSSYGPFVDSIDGVVGGTNGKYWTFYVNGAQASVGAGTYVTRSSDQIEWKFQ
jgi:hypothetical protein